MLVIWAVDAAVTMDRNVFAESSNFDEVLFDFADQLGDAGE